MSGARACARKILDKAAREIGSWRSNDDAFQKALIDIADDEAVVEIAAQFGGKICLMPFFVAHARRDAAEEAIRLMMSSLARGLDRHPLIASEIIDLYARRHPAFWRGRLENVQTAMLRRRIESSYGWTLHLIQPLDAPDRPVRVSQTIRPCPLRRPRSRDSKSAGIWLLRLARSDHSVSYVHRGLRRRISELSRDLFDCRRRHASMRSPLREGCCVCEPASGLLRPVTTPLVLLSRTSAYLAAKVAENAAARLRRRSKNKPKTMLTLSLEPLL
jgi:hypothetical protein